MNADFALRSFVWNAVNASKVCLKSFKCFKALFVVTPHRYVRHDSLNFTSTWQESRNKLVNNCTNISLPFGWCSKEPFTWNWNNHPLHLLYYKPESFNKKMERSFDWRNEFWSFIPALVICNMYRPWSGASGPSFMLWLYNERGKAAAGYRILRCICFCPTFLFFGQLFQSSEHNLQLPSPVHSVVITHMQPALSLLETPRKCSPLAAETLLPFELLNQLRTECAITR